MISKETMDRAYHLIELVYYHPELDVLICYDGIVLWRDSLNNLEVLPYGANPTDYGYVLIGEV